MKIIALSVSAVGLLYATVTNVLLIVSDAGWIAISSIAASFFSFMAVILTLLINRKVNVVKQSIDGLLDEKTAADVEKGAKRQLEKTAHEEAIGNKRELQSIKEQQLLHQTPPNRDTTTSDVKEIIEAVEQKGDETQDVIESKGDETKVVVKKIPDEVVKKLPPK